MFLFFCLFVGQVVKQIAPKLGVPFTSLLTIIGFLMGFFVQNKDSMLFKAMYPWEHMDPHVMLALFMPALIFESAFKTDWHIFKHSVG
jgi:NhaP-type Na+/H+ or K+/H+ antiporter